MVDILALAVSHGLLALAVWRLLLRDDLYDDSPRRKESRSKTARRTGTGSDA